MKLYHDSQGIELYHGDCLQVLKELPAESVHCVVTSPPYWGLRDYGTDGQLGLEETPEQHVSKMVEVFSEVRRVLRTDGTLWLNYGDSYAASGASLKPKDLCGIPWRVAFALQADGWWLRQDIIWHKPNPMPESVTDRCTKAHEYIFLLTKAAKYHYDADAIREKTGNEMSSQEYDTKTASGAAWRSGGVKNYAGANKKDGGRSHPNGRNRRSVWTIPTAPYPGAHFATFPPKLIEPCIMAGTSEQGACRKCGAPLKRMVEQATGGAIGQSWHSHDHDDTRGNSKTASSKGYTPGKTIGWKNSCNCKPGKSVRCTVLDPFLGSGTTGAVAQKNGCKFIGIELNEDYLQLAVKRFTQKVLF